MIKRINLLMLIWICIFTITGVSESSQLRYEVICDIGSDELQIKERIFDVYQSIVKGVDQDDRATIVLKNSHLFQLESDWKISQDQDTIFIKIGSGKGSMFSGEFEWSLCYNNVKPKSWIKEVLGF